jgi:hypothetical protein
MKPEIRNEEKGWYLMFKFHYVQMKLKHDHRKYEEYHIEGYV